MVNLICLSIYKIKSVNKFSKENVLCLFKRKSKKDLKLLKTKKIINTLRKIKMSEFTEDMQKLCSFK